MASACGRLRLTVMFHVCYVLAWYRRVAVSSEAPGLTRTVSDDVPASTFADMEPLLAIADAMDVREWRLVLSACLGKLPDLERLGTEWPEGARAFLQCAPALREHLHGDGSTWGVVLTFAVRTLNDVLDADFEKVKEGELLTI